MPLPSPGGNFARDVAGVIVVVRPKVTYSKKIPLPGPLILKTLKFKGENHYSANFQLAMFSNCNIDPTTTAKTTKEIGVLHREYIW